jgi:hypothetical protein
MNPELLNPSALLMVKFSARREEKQILRCAQDDLSFASEARNLVLVALSGRAAHISVGDESARLRRHGQPHPDGIS